MKCVYFYQSGNRDIFCFLKKVWIFSRRLYKLFEKVFAGLFIWCALLKMWFSVHLYICMCYICAIVAQGLAPRIPVWDDNALLPKSVAAVCPRGHPTIKASMRQICGQLIFLLQCRETLVPIAMDNDHNQSFQGWCSNPTSYVNMSSSWSSPSFLGGPPPSSSPFFVL